MTWTKYPAETITVPADWNDLIQPGDAIQGAVSITIEGVSTGLAASILSTDDKVSLVRITGGTAKTRVNLVFNIPTAGGDTYTPVKTLVILSKSDPNWA